MAIAEPTPYADLNVLLCAWVDGVAEELDEALVGVYLLGSFAVGDFDVHSDVDFVAVVADPLPLERLAALQALHGRIHDLPNRWAKHLDGSYMPREIARRRDPAHTPLPYLDRGTRALVHSDHCNRHVVRWMARERGIPLAGPAARTLIDPVPVDELRLEVSRDMRGWEWLIRSGAENMDNRWYQPYAVLSYCRMLYTLETGEITSKPKAGAWGMASLDPRWSGLIERALEQRPDPGARLRQRADPDDLAATLDFIAYALGFCD